MKKQIYCALRNIIQANLREAYIRMDVVDFKSLLTEIKEVIQSYEDIELKERTLTTSPCGQGGEGQGTEY